MRKRAQSGGEAADVNITPLLDIVFILLIFFIVTATFLREQGIDVRTPDDSEQDDNSIPPPALLLSVQEDGFVQVDFGRIIDPGSVKPVVEEFIAREPRGVVLVSAAPEAESGVAVEVMDQAKAGNAGSVSLTVQQTQ